MAGLYIGGGFRILRDGPDQAPAVVVRVAEEHELGVARMEPEFPVVLRSPGSQRPVKVQPGRGMGRFLPALKSGAPEPGNS
ncbi:MAG: hypothetical protein A2001_12090 [Treponema sp. GWC1_61_84]|nr:MAG: hypothetical protein A2001_12090 [Treponema sp. GWC1_61_84]